MKYYLHDTNSFNDAKITELFIAYGYEGLGLFYTILEKLALQEKPIKTDVLKHQLKVGKKLEKCWKFMEEIGILSSENGETSNKRLANFSEKYKIKKEKTAKRVSEHRENQEDTKDVTRYNDDCNADNSIVSNSNIIKEINKEKTDDLESKIEKTAKAMVYSIALERKLVNKRVEEYKAKNGGSIGFSALSDIEEDVRNSLLKTA